MIFQNLINEKMNFQKLFNNRFIKTKVPGTLVLMNQIKNSFRKKAVFSSVSFVILNAVKNLLVNHMRSFAIAQDKRLTSNQRFELSAQSHSQKYLLPLVAYFWNSLQKTYHYFSEKTVLKNRVRASLFYY